MGELWELEKTFCNLTESDKLMENKKSSNSRITSIEDNNILHNFNDVNINLNTFTVSEKLETQIKHINWKL